MTPRQLTKASLAAAAVLLVAPAVSGCDTYHAGDCTGVVKAAIHQGLVIASVSAVCYGNVPPTSFDIGLYLYADGQLVQQTYSGVIPDAQGYALTVSVVCTVATYRATAKAIATFPDGTHTGRGSSSVKVSKQSDCSQTFNP